MSKLILEISDDVAELLQLSSSERLSCLQRELAIRLYQKGLLFFGKARELAQMTKCEFHSLIGDEAIERSYDLEELSSDLNTLETLK